MKHVQNCLITASNDAISNFLFGSFVMMNQFETCLDLFNYCTTFCNNNINCMRLYNLSMFQVNVLQYIWLTDTDPLTDSHTPILEMLSHLKIQKIDPAIVKGGIEVLNSTWLLLQGVTNFNKILNLLASILLNLWPF